MTRIKNTYLAALAVLLLPLAVSADPISTLYISDGSTIRTVNGTNVTNSWSATSHGEFALAVDGKISTLQSFNRSSHPGSLYNFDGIFLGETASAPSINALDGATDGTNNYATCYNQRCGGDVYMFDADWSNAQLLFNIGDYDALGITYDPFSSSLWVATFGTQSTITNYSLNGDEISSFITGTHNYLRGLAMDYADGSLWITSGGSSLVQYSTAGALLDVVNVSGLTGASQGMEADIGAYLQVPEPGTLALLGLGLAGIGFARRKKV